MTAAQLVLGVQSQNASWGHGLQADSEEQKRNVEQVHILHGVLALDWKIVLPACLCCAVQDDGHGELMLLSDCVGVEVGEQAERGWGGRRS